MNSNLFLLGPLQFIECMELYVIHSALYNRMNRMQYTLGTLFCIPAHSKYCYCGHVPKETGKYIIFVLR